MKFLIVADNPDMRELLSVLVGQMGYLPVLASDGKEGLEKAFAERYYTRDFTVSRPLLPGHSRSNPPRLFARHPGPRSSFLAQPRLAKAPLPLRARESAA